MGVKKYRFIPEFEDEASIIRQQLDGVRWTMRQASASSQYKAMLDACGASPEDIKSLDDLRLLPLTSPEDLREGYPLPLLSIPERDIVRIHSSSGTTGKRKILAYSRHDVDNFALQMARCYEMAGLSEADRVQIAVGYGLWTAGAGFQAGSELFGAMTVPVGPGNLDIHLQMLQDMQSTCFCATASMALLLAEEVERGGLAGKIRLRRIIFGSETCSDRMRVVFESALRLEGSYDIGGMTEMYGPGASIECAARQGLHYWPDFFYVEIINPQTLEPVKPGEMGEMVVTSLRKEAVPLIRYRTRDITRILPGVCACGLNLPRHDRIHARSDDMFIIRGVNIYPGQIMDALAHFPELGGEWHISLTRVDGRDYMELTAERNNGASSDMDKALAERVADHLRNRLMVSARTRIVDHGSLPRAVGKSKRVADLR